MAQWVVVTTALKVAVRLVVDDVIEREELGSGRVRWLVACPHGVQDLIWMVPGVISVDPAEPRGEAERFVQVA